MHEHKCDAFTTKPLGPQSVEEKEVSSVSKGNVFVHYRGTRKEHGKKRNEEG
eukprot:CAMPEP_0185839322 /NCGR_PEP_ID=MMETSP1353-20130828/14415_1 /TAXON_ID=1077150 /ORGANISM="Erythrolobus australicus, Strain CCMP3124" /LENGTH=51 /DNA_ID=CAMNT_0028538467 /DNA_START=82 /DNA_END=234 /DNA_ORIENTATION=-